MIKYNHIEEVIRLVKKGMISYVTYHSLYDRQK